MADSLRRDQESFKGPDIIVIGAMRCATTSLYEILRVHPDFEVTSVKETDFFLPNEFKGGLNAFKKLVTRFDLPIVDVSPNYSNNILWPGTAKRIYETNPSAKLIYIVRDPVERSISAYNTLFLSNHRLPEPEDVVKLTESEVLSGSQYALQLKSYLQYWNPEDICIVDYNKLIEQPAETVSEMMFAIGFPCEPRRISLAKKNATSSLRRMPKTWARMRDTEIGRCVRRILPHAMNQRVKSLVFAATPDQPPPPKFSPSARNAIAEYLKHDVAEFRQITGRDFSHWSI